MMGKIAWMMGKIAWMMGKIAWMMEVSKTSRPQMVHDGQMMTKRKAISEAPPSLSFEAMYNPLVFL